MPRTYMFDAYGTLFDVHSAIVQAGQPLGAQAPAFSALWRQKQLEYTWTYTLMGLAGDPALNFEGLTARALNFTIEKFGINPPGMRDALLAAYQTLAAFPDVIPALTDLRNAGHSTAIFTNGTANWITAAMNAAGLTPLINTVVTVEPVGRFKPEVVVYEHARQAVGAGAPADVVFVSSNRWDVAGAARYGFTPVWVNRTGQPAEYTGLDPIVLVGDLSGLGGV